MYAAGQYLRVFREARGMSQEDVAEKIGVASKSVYNWEAGQETKSRSLAAWIRSVQAVSDDVISLLDNEDATQEDGQRLAETRLSVENIRQLDEVTQQVGPDAVLQAAFEVLQSPELQQEILRRAAAFEDSPQIRDRRPAFLRRRRKNQ